MSGNRPDSIRSHRDIEVWQVAVDVSVSIYATTKSLPREEIYGLTSQMRGASVTIAANIAEGYGRETTATYIQFLRVAQGSTKELETHLVIAERIGLLNQAAADELKARLNSIGRMLRALIRSLETRLWTALKPPFTIGHCPLGHCPPIGRLAIAELAL